MQVGQGFDFQARPGVVRNQPKFRKQYEDEFQQPSTQNLMFDKRVVRGNTYAAIVTSKNTEQFKDTSKLTRSLKRPQKQMKEEIQPELQEPGTPPPVEGREHASVETDQYVETLTDKPPNYEKDTQTDFFIDKPIMKLEIKQPKAEEKETQVWDTDLFNFDNEVVPILQVLIGKTLEQSRMEVLEEEELKIMKEQQKRFEQLQNAERAEMLKLEAKENRLREENERRKTQYQAKHDQNKQSHKKIISRVLAKNYLSSLQPQVIDILKNQGVFRHPLEMTLLHKFLPWVYENVSSQLQSKNTSNTQIIDLLSQGLSQTQNSHQESLLKEKQRREQVLEERRLAEEERQRVIAEKKEARRIKKEMERREGLKQQIREKLLPKGNITPGMLTQQLADIDFHSPETIGIFGGLIGEVVIFMSYVAGQESLDQGLRNYCSSSENIVAVFKEILQKIFQEGSLQLQVDQAVDEKIKEIVGEGEEDNPTDISKWNLAPEERIPEVIEIVKDHICNLTLRTMKANAEAFGIAPEIIDELITTLLKIVDKESQTDKIKWVKVAPVDSFDQIGVAYMRPQLESLGINKNSDKANIDYDAQNEDGEEIPKPVPTNLAEGDYENNQTVFPQSDDDIKVMTQHPVAELLIRDEILKIIAGSVQSVNGNEYNILLETTDGIKELQQKILDTVQPEYPVLDMEQY